MILFHPKFHRREDPTPNLYKFVGFSFRHGFFQNRKNRFNSKRSFFGAIVVVAPSWFFI